MSNTDTDGPTMIDYDDGPLDPALYGLGIPADATSLPPDRDAALAAFHEASRPDEPTIRKPGTGETDLLVGLSIDGEVYTHAVVRELKGSDEEVMSKLSTDRGLSLYYAQIEDMVLKRAVISIGPGKPTAEQLADLLIGDRGKLFSAVLIATYGETKEYKGLRCPHCEALNDIEIDIPGLIETKAMKTAEPFIAVKLRDGKSITVRYPTGRDQMQVMLAKKDATAQEQNTLMLGRCIVNDTIADRTKFALELGALDRRTLIDAMTGNSPSVSFKEVSVPCPSCNEDMPFPFGWADLLFP